MESGLGGFVLLCGSDVCVCMCVTSAKTSPTQRSELMVPGSWKAVRVASHFQLPPYWSREVGLSSELYPRDQFYFFSLLTFPGKILPPKWGGLEPTVFGVSLQASSTG